MAVLFAYLATSGATAATVQALRPSTLSLSASRSMKVAGASRRSAAPGSRSVGAAESATDFAQPADLGTLGRAELPWLFVPLWHLTHARSRRSARAQSRHAKRTAAHAVPRAKTCGQLSNPNSPQKQRYRRRLRYAWPSRPVAVPSRNLKPQQSTHLLSASNASNSKKGG